MLLILRSAVVVIAVPATTTNNIVHEFHVAGVANFRVRGYFLGGIFPGI